MKEFIGTKILMAVAMTLGDYNLKRGWTIPENENPMREGYFVEYPDGYKSWSPKEVFEESYRETNGKMTFGLVIEALRIGKCVSRHGWNGKGLFVCKQVPAKISKDIVTNMQSLPYSAKNLLKDGIEYKNQMIIIDSSGIANSWVPSSSDIFAEDWVIVS